MSNAIPEIEMLSGKTVVIGRGVPNLSPALKNWRMNVAFDIYGPMDLKNLLGWSQAHIALHSVLSVAQADQVLELPKEMQKRFVVFKSGTANGYKDIKAAYKKLDKAEIPFVWEDPKTWTNAVFALALIQAVKAIA